LDDLILDATAIESAIPSPTPMASSTAQPIPFDDASNSIADISISSDGFHVLIFILSAILGVLLLKELSWWKW